MGVASTVGSVSGPSASATVCTAGSAGEAYAWSDVATTSRSRCPASTRRTIPGSVTVTGVAASTELGRPVRRTGATRPDGSVAAPCGSTS